MGFYRSKQSGKLGLSFLCVCTFRKDEGLDEAVKMQLWACHCAVCQAHDPLAPLLRSNSGKGSLVVDFSPLRSELSRWWISEARSSHVKARCERFPSSVCGSSMRQATWQVDVVWGWSAAWRCWGGDEPDSSQWDHFCQGKRKVLAVLITAAQHLCPHPPHWQALPWLLVMKLNLVNKTKIKGLV